jgi:uncharacterized membrane protein
MTLYDTTQVPSSRRMRTSGGWERIRAGEQGEQSQGISSAPVNVGESERIVSVAAGALSALMGLRRGSLPGLLVAGVGGALIYRGVTGHCAAYQSLGLDTANGDDAEQTEQELNERGIKIAQSMLISRPAEELYNFWRNFENLPRIMTHLESVKNMEGGRSHWVAKMQSLGGKRLEWDAEITADEPNQSIAWRSLPGADVDHTGDIRFEKALGDRGTIVGIRMNYLPPAGRIGHWVASLAGNNPKRVIGEDLRNFKRLIEVGEILTIIGQPHGTCKGQGEYYTESKWKPLFT